jgi:glycosyltransferase involved in cell wall biosynthesis
MLGDARIAVVVPAYDEAPWIGETLRAVPAYVDDVVVVDDGSRDRTAAIVAGTSEARVTLVRHARNQGVGAALRTGYAHAFARGADVVAVMAGDGQMHADDLVALLAPVVSGQADYAKGDRLSHARAWRAMPRARLLGNHVLSLCTRWATGLAVRDSQCGYTALARRAAERVPLDDLWRGYGYPNDLLGLLAATGARVRDVVVRPVYRGEASGIGVRHALVVIPYVLARVVMRRLTRAWRERIAAPAGSQPRCVTHTAQCALES